MTSTSILTLYWLVLTLYQLLLTLYQLLLTSIEYSLISTDSLLTFTCCYWLLLTFYWEPNLVRAFNHGWDSWILEKMNKNASLLPSDSLCWLGQSAPPLLFSMGFVLNILDRTWILWFILHFFKWFQQVFTAFRGWKIFSQIFLDMKETWSVDDSSTIEV